MSTTFLKPHARLLLLLHQLHGEMAHVSQTGDDVGGKFVVLLVVDSEVVSAVCQIVVLQQTRQQASAHLKIVSIYISHFFNPLYNHNCL